MARSVPYLALEDARCLIAAAERTASAMLVPCSIAVADAAGGLIAHVRMDGAWLGSVDLAINKAWTAAAFQRTTEELAALAQSGAPVFGLNTTNGSRVIIFGGGIPIVIGHQIAGAIGVSGGSVQDDVAIARAAVNAAQK